MSIFTEIKNYFGGEQKSALSLTEPAGWYDFLSLIRPNRRIRYNENSAFEAYRSHELVFACVNKIADVMNDAEIIVERKTADGDWKKQDGHLLPALFKRPNKMQTGRDIRKLMVQSEQGAGRFFIILNRSGAGIPVEMEIVNPNRITPKWNQARDKITHYEYRRKDGRPVPIRVEDVLVRRRADLIDQFYGFAPVTAALKSVNSDLGLTDYVDAFFESDGTPSGILKILNASLSDTRKEEIATKWRQKYSRGGSNQKGVAVLDQNVDYQKIGANLDELDAEPVGDRFESRICSVFGVPPILVGALVGLRHSTNNATMRAALRDFWDNKVSTELAGFREYLTWFVLPEFEGIDAIVADKVRVAFDISQAAFLQEDLNDIHERTREDFKAGFVTLNEAREAVKLKPDPQGDYYLQPSMVTPISPENQAQIAIRKVEQGKETEEQEKPATGDDEEIGKALFEFFKSKPKMFAQITGLEKFESEKKTFELDGLTLAREPRGVEILLDLKSMVQDFETEKEKASKILKTFRNELIDLAVIASGNLTPETVYQLTLAPNPKTRKQIGKVLKSAFERGRAQVAAEIEAQKDVVAKTAKNMQESRQTKDIFDDNDGDAESIIERLTDLIVSKIINEVQSRTVNWFVVLKQLGSYTSELLREKLLGESEKFIEQQAGIVANLSISAGRKDEILRHDDEIKHFEYSAILDLRTCGDCKKADGMTADSMTDLPDVPNPDCDGMAQCRCFIVGVIE